MNLRGDAKGLAAVRPLSAPEAHRPPARATCFSLLARPRDNRSGQSVGAALA